MTEQRGSAATRQRCVIVETEEPVEGLPLGLSHALRVTRLDDHHTDPIDRLLVTQTTIQQATLISTDTSLAAYDIEVINATT